MGDKYFEWWLLWFVVWSIRIVMFVNAENKLKCLPRLLRWKIELVGFGIETVHSFILFNKGTKDLLILPTLAEWKLFFSFLTLLIVQIFMWTIKYFEYCIQLFNSTELNQKYLWRGQLPVCNYLSIITSNLLLVTFLHSRPSWEWDLESWIWR